MYTQHKKYTRKDPILSFFYAGNLFEVICRPDWTQGCRNSNKKIYSKNERSFHKVKLYNNTYSDELTRPPPTSLKLIKIHTASANFNNTASSPLNKHK